MALDYDHVMGLKSQDQAYSYSDRETMLYALGLGYGHDALDRNELPFVYEKDLKTVPTQATVVAWGAGDTRSAGINYLLVLHGEQRLTIHKPLPFAADLLADWRVTGLVDKGADKGALLISETVLKDKASGEKLATLSGATFARGDGGFGGPREGGPAPHPIPDRAPDAMTELTTRDDQALIYRLSGDRNPLHSDPDIAKAAGFDKPILHGLCTYGLCCRAIIQTHCDFDPTRIHQFDVRFSAPVYPGETITVKSWVDGKTISFEAEVKERGVTVIKNGKCVLF